MAEPLKFRTTSRITLTAGTDASARFPLNALDHAMVEGLAEVVYLYRHTLDPQRLQQSLRSVLLDFPVLCGRLRPAAGGALSIDATRQGIPFTVGECNLTLEAVASGLHDAYTIYDFIDRINPLLLARTNRPLLTVRLTRMNGGGCALGISCAHAVADGYSFYYFIRNWSRVHEGLPAETPWHERSAISFDDAAASGPPRQLPRTCNGFRCLSTGELLSLGANFLSHRSSLVCRVLRFNRQQLAAIKNAACRQGPVSLNDALSAHLWQIFTKLQNKADRTASRKLLFGAGMRSQIDHPRAQHYFGNVISNVDIVCGIDELTGADIAAIAGRCRQGVAALDRDYFKIQMLWLRAREKNKQMLRVFADVNPYAGDCVISSLSRLPVYDACFDGGMPFWAGVPAVPFPWVMYLLPCPAEGGGIEVYANLPRSSAGKLMHDEWQAELYKYGTAGDDATPAAADGDQEYA